MANHFFVKSLFKGAAAVGAAFGGAVGAGVAYFKDVPKTADDASALFEVVNFVGKKTRHLAVGAACGAGVGLGLSLFAPAVMVLLPLTWIGFVPPETLMRPLAAIASAAEKFKTS